VNANLPQKNKAAPKAVSSVELSVIIVIKTKGANIIRLSIKFACARFVLPCNLVRPSLGKLSLWPTNSETEAFPEKIDDYDCAKIIIKNKAMLHNKYFSSIGIIFSFLNCV
jgi:hypothetical protein